MDVERSLASQRGDSEIIKRLWWLFSFFALISLAGSNFLIKVVAKNAKDKAKAGRSTIFIFWAVAGSFGLIARSLRVKMSSGDYGLGGRVHVLLSCLVGVLSALATLGLSMAFAADIANVAPISAMLPLNSLVVCLLTRVTIGEKLKYAQVAGILVAIAGPVCLAFADTHAAALEGLSMGGAAAFTFGFTHFLQKWIVWHGGAKSADILSVSLCAVAACAVIALGCCYATVHRLPGLDSSRLVLVAVGGGVLWSSGLLFLQVAILGAAGPSAAIANANCLGVFLLDVLTYGTKIKSLQLIGVLLCLLGVSVLSLAGTSQIPRHRSDPLCAAQY